MLRAKADLFLIVLSILFAQLPSSYAIDPKSPAALVADDPDIQGLAIFRNQNGSLSLIIDRRETLETISIRARYKLIMGDRGGGPVVQYRNSDPDEPMIVMTLIKEDQTIRDHNFNFSDTDKIGVNTFLGIHGSLPNRLRDELGLSQRSSLSDEINYYSFNNWLTDSSGTVIPIDRIRSIAIRFSRRDPSEPRPDEFTFGIDEIPKGTVRVVFGKVNIDPFLEDLIRMGYSYEESTMILNGMATDEDLTEVVKKWENMKKKIFEFGSNNQALRVLSEDESLFELLKHSRQRSFGFSEMSPGNFQVTHPVSQSQSLCKNIF